MTGNTQPNANPGAWRNAGVLQKMEAPSCGPIKQPKEKMQESLMRYFNRTAKTLAWQDLGVDM